MNRAYKLVWNTVSSSWVVASELAKGAKKSSSKGLKLALLLSGMVTAGAVHAAIASNALPSGEMIFDGSSTIDRSVANQLTVNQTASFTNILWNSFNVGKDAKVIFNQPSASSVALSNVLDGNPSEILGQVQANGKFYLVNHAGITFGVGSQVNASAIVAATAGFTGANNTGTNIDFGINAGTSINNYGTLTATAGDVILIADTIINVGTISATGGNVYAINAEKINLQTEPTITTASATTGLISNSGVIQATQVSSVGGKILLTGDTSQASSQIQLAGTLAADSTSVTGRSIDFNGTLDINGSSHALALTSTNAYSLSNAAKVNLNGSAAAFSANGDAYTVVHDLSQFQNLNSNKSGKYVVAADIDGASASFTRIGDPTLAFSGVVDGLGHKVSNLNIGQSGMNAVGLFGVTSNATLRNIGVQGLNVTARNQVGVLVGSMQGGSISNSYAFGNVSRNGANGSYYGGGLVGQLQGGSISNSYAGATVTSGSGQNVVSSIGGLVGYNIGGSISNSYATGVLQSTQDVGSIVFGGLVGTSNGGTISNSYAAGVVNDQSSGIGVTKGGLVGAALGGLTTNNSYWNKDVTGLATSAAGTGLTTAQMKQLSSFTNWSIDADGGTDSIWRIYEGSTAPLLRSFLKSLNMTVNNSDSKTYDGTQYSTASSLDYVINSSGYDNTKLLGTAVLGGTALGARNAGSYTFDVGGLYSVQDGYDFVVSKGTLNIAKASLVISSADVSKIYDGTTAAAGSAVVIGGTQLFGSDSISGGTFAFDNKNAGSNKHVSVSGVTVNDGNAGNNYTVSYADNTDGMINRAGLSITSTDVTKTYDGTRNAVASAVITGGTQLFGSDSISGGTFEFDSKNAGVPNAILTSGVTLNDGNGGNNYNISYTENSNAVINKRLLTLTATAASKEYDGNVRIEGKPLISGRQRGDSISGLSQSFADKNAGTGKTVLVNGGFVINDENGGNNYTVVLVDSHGGVITPKALTISTVANTKVYDGGLTSASKPVVAGLIVGDRVTGLFQQYESKTVGENKKLLVKAGYVLQDGNGGANYAVTEQGSNDGVITVH